jgi:two-component system chemotaxis response regulator CheB
MLYKAVVIGTSAGGLSALDKIFSGLDENFNLPVILVQHKHVESDDYLAKYLNRLSHLNIKEADEKEPIKEGNVYIAPADYHLLIEEDFTLSLNIDERVHYCRPSIDVLFETAADAYGRHLIGIILTGANEDGTQGMIKIKEEGGLTIAQNPKSAEVAYMPKSVIEKIEVDYILNLEMIAQLLNKINK